jgi:hypothetical protein
MRGERDWIVMKALEKDRTRRYETANGLAKDVERYLAGDAVEACPPTLAYRVRKAYRRNRVAVLVTGLFTLFVTCSAAISLGLALVARRAERDTDLQRAAAEDARGEANQQRDIALKAGREAAEQRDKTKVALGVVQTEQDRTRRLLYAGHLSHASMAFSEGRAGQLFRLLDEATPRPGEPDLRGWEWHYLDRLTRSGREYKAADVGMSVGGLAGRFNASAPSRDWRWTVTPRTVGDGFVFDVADTATGRRTAQVPKGEVLKGDPPVWQLSEDGRHMLVAPADPGTGRTRIWEVETCQEVPAPREPLKLPCRSNRSHVAVGAGGKWVAWLEATANRPTVSRLGVKGPVEYNLARWDASADRVSRAKVAIGKGWGTTHIAPDGRAVHWRPVAESPATTGGGAPNSPDEFGEYQVWHVGTEAQLRCAIRVPADLGPGGVVTHLSASGTMLAVREGQTVTVHDLSDGRAHWRLPIPPGYGEVSGLARRGYFSVSDDGNRVAFLAPEVVTVADRKATGEGALWRLFYRQTEGGGPFGIPPGGSLGRDNRFQLLPDGRTCVHRTTASVRSFDLSREPSGLVAPSAPGARQLVTDAAGRAWVVLATADGRRTVKWPAPPRPDEAARVEPRHLLVLYPDGKELARWELAGPGRGSEFAGLSPPVSLVDSGRRLLVNTFHPKDARPGLTYLSLPPGQPGVVPVFTREWALYDLKKAGVRSGGRGDKLPRGSAGVAVPLLHQCPEFTGRRGCRDDVRPRAGDAVPRRADRQAGP